MKILYLLSDYNIYGGTPKKILELIKHSQNSCYLYMYESGNDKFKHLFEEAGAKISDGYTGRNIFKHVRSILSIIDNNNIEIVQTQFSMGEVLGFIIKIFRPKVKLIIVFESTIEPNFFKKHILNFTYRSVNMFVYISKYVKKYKTMQFPVLTEKYSKTIYNGTEKRKIIQNNYPEIDPTSTSLLSIGGLINLKNLDILIDACDILINQRKLHKINLYIVGDGPERNRLEKKIEDLGLRNNVFFLGYQKNIGALLARSNIYLHPSYAEGFGIAVAEAMMAEKPIIVAKSGALPELIENEISGLVIDPFNAEDWANAIIRLIDNKKLGKELAHKARKKAEKEFSIGKFVGDYEKLYQDLLNK
ncbi:MAG: glycosyltransferase family 4 protein [Flavobacteriaceae bacterium]|nr:glycosyltransferase family 4 protein [Flavobacteriaceae bacterium]